MLDKTAVREMLAQYKSWNDSEQLARIEDALRRTHEESLQLTLELSDLCRELGGSDALRLRPRPELDDYFEKILRFETSRRAKSEKQSPGSRCGRG